MRNLLITIQYDGKNFRGWQIQKNGVTVQEVFQNALTEVVGEYSDLKGCSRTDSGVHANMYCISVRIKHPIPPERLKAALNRWLPSSVVCLDCKEAEDDFHARYCCKSKQYIYKIWNSDTRNPFLDGYALFYRYKLDEEILNRAAQAYVGSHDFTSFCTKDKREMGDMTRNVKMFSVKRDGDLVTMTVEADGFLYNMVRIMVGTLLEIAQGKIAPDAIADIIEKKDRSFAGATARACGLYLNKVNY
ncbi:MAG: tRNA pseudouridine(38-40) synthase TruA [Ruminococcus sp.]|nr:tRNA pseudouridine(38-40) synthase TruA [Ruminococcus sp.]